jgi:hypothetical protein
MYYEIVQHIGIVTTKYLLTTHRTVLVRLLERPEGKRHAREETHERRDTRGKRGAREGMCRGRDMQCKRHVKEGRHTRGKGHTTEGTHEGRDA